MLKRVLFFSLLTFSALLGFSQQVKQIPNGISAHLASYNVDICFYNNSIIRVMKYPTDSTIHKKSLSVVLTPEKGAINVIRKGTFIIVRSTEIQLMLNLTSGAIVFSNNSGNELLKEQPYGFTMTPVKDANLSRYHAKQIFLRKSGEPLYGLGEQQNGKLNQINETIHLENSNMSVGIPLFLSNKGYGVFWDNYSPTDFIDKNNETSFDSEIADCGDYYFMYGKTAEGVVAQMRKLTGKAPLMPFWTFGFNQSRERYKTQFELLDVVKKYRSLHVPLDGIVQDWQYWGKDSSWNAMSFDPVTYPQPKKWIDSIHDLHAHLFIVAWPGFGPKTPQYQELDKKHLLIDFHTWPPNSGAKVYDPYSQKAADIYWKYLNKGIFSLGIDAWWLDSSEPDHIDVKSEDFLQQTAMGSFRSVQNAFPLMHVGNVYKHQRANTNNQRVSILTRSAFAGQQRFAANTWSGDVNSQWSVLKKQIPAALNFTMTGIPYWNADIGGFFAGDYVKGGGAKNPKFQELYTRWLEFAAFTPLMRSHGTDIPREIYQFGERGDWAFDAQERFINIRYHLLPYLYSTAWNVTHSSGSFMRALVFDYPADKKVYDIGDEFLLGKSILVHPVTDEGARSQSVYLPTGQWYDFWTGERLSGGRSIERNTPMGEIPLYFKAGSIIPWGPKVEYTAEKTWEKLEIRVYPGSNGEFVLYEDEGNNYNYEKGKYSEIHFNWNDKNKLLTISKRNGAYNGMIKLRVFNIVIVNEKSGPWIENSTKIMKTINYDGRKASYLL